MAIVTSALLAGLVVAGTSAVAQDLYHSATDFMNPNKGKRKRRTSADYAGTSFTRTSDIFSGLKGPWESGMQDINVLKGLDMQALEPLKGLNKHFKPVTRTYRQNSEFTSLTDPLQVNSLSDVLLNQEGKAIIMEDLKLDGTVLDLPILREIVVGVDMLNEKYLKPVIKDKNIGTAFMNGLNALGENMDTIDFAQVVKGLVLDKDKSKVLSRSLGFGSEGKYNYNYNTGNGWKDLALETISSPGLMLSVGKGLTAGAVRKGYKELAEESLDLAVSNSGELISPQALKSFKNQAANLATKGRLGLITQDELTEGLTNLADRYNLVSKTTTSPKFIQEFQKNFNEKAIGQMASSALKGYKVIAPLDEMNDALSAFTLKTFLTAGTYPFARQTYDPIIEAMRKRTLRTLGATAGRAQKVFGKTADDVEVLINPYKYAFEHQDDEIRDGIWRMASDEANSRELPFTGSYNTERIITMMKQMDSATSAEDAYEYILRQLSEDAKLIDDPRFNIDTVRANKDFRDLVTGSVYEGANQLRALDKAYAYAQRHVEVELTNITKSAPTSHEGRINLEKYLEEKGTALTDLLNNINRELDAQSGNLPEMLRQKAFMDQLLRDIGTSFDEVLEHPETYIYVDNVAAEVYAKRDLVNNVRNVAHTANLVDETTLTEVLRKVDLTKDDYKGIQDLIMELGLDPDATTLARLQEIADNLNINDAFVKRAGELTQMIKPLRADADLIRKPLDNLYKMFSLKGRESFYKAAERLLSTVESADDAEILELFMDHLMEYSKNNDYNVIQYVQELSRDVVFGDKRTKALFEAFEDKMYANLDELIETWENNPLLDSYIKNTDLYPDAHTLDLMPDSNSDVYLDEMLQRNKKISYTIKSDLDAKIRAQEALISASQEKVVNLTKLEPVKPAVFIDSITKSIDDYGGITFEKLMEIPGLVKRVIDVIPDERLIPLLVDTEVALDSLKVKAEELLSALHLDAEDLGDMAFAEGIPNFREIQGSLDQLAALTSKGEQLTFYYAPAVHKGNIQEVMGTLKQLDEQITQAIEHQNKLLKEGADNLKKVDANITPGKSRPVVLETLKELQDQISNTYVDIIEVANLNNTSSSKYLLQELKAVSRLEILRDMSYGKIGGVPFFEVLQDIVSAEPKTPIGALINAVASTKQGVNQLSVDTAGLARTLINTADSNNNYMMLLDSVRKYKTPKSLSKTMDKALEDILESFAGKDPAKMIKKLQDPTFLEAELNKRLFSSDRIGGFKLENYYEKFVSSKYSKAGKLTAHVGADDAEMTARVFEHLLNQKAADVPVGVPFIVFDIETTGLSQTAARVGDAQVLQISAVRKVRNANGSVTTVGKAYDSLVKPDPGRNIDHLQRANLGDGFLNMLEKAKTIGGTEQEALDGLQDFIGDTKIIVGHNSNEFDLNFLQHRGMRFNKDVNFIDTYQVLLAKEAGTAKYSPEALAEHARWVSDHREMLLDYANKQVKNGNPFVRTLDGNMANDLFEFFRSIEHVQANANKVGLQGVGAEALESSIRTMNGADSSAAVYLPTSEKAALNAAKGTDEIISQYAQDNAIKIIRDALTARSERNAYLSQFYIDAADLKALEGHSNIMAFLTGRNEAGEYVEDFIPSTIGVKTLYSEKHLPILNNIPANQHVMVYAELQKWQKLMDSRYDLMFATGHKLNPNLLPTIKAALIEDFGSHNLLKFVNMDQSSVYELATLYDVLSFKNKDMATNRFKIQDLLKNSGLYEKTNMLNIAKPEEAFADLELLQDKAQSVEARTEAKARLLAANVDLVSLQVVQRMTEELGEHGRLPSTISPEVLALMNKEQFKGHALLQPAREALEERALFTDVDRVNWNTMAAEPRFDNETKSVLTLDPESMVKHLNDHSFMTVLPTSELDEYATYVKYLLDNVEAYRAVGTDIFIDERYGLVIKLMGGKEDVIKSVAKNTEYVLNYKGVLDRSKVPDKYLSLWDKVERQHNTAQNLADVKSPFDAYNSVGDTLSAKDYKSRFLSKFDKDILDTLPNEKFQNEFFYNFSHDDFTVLGRAEARKEWNTYVTLDPLNAAIKRTDRMLTQSNAFNRYVEVLFNDDLVASRSMMFKNMSDEQFYSMFRDNDGLTAVYVTEGKDHIQAKAFRPNNLEEARVLRTRGDAIVVDTAFANTLMGTLNDARGRFKENHPWLHKWREYVIGTYQSIFLTSTGFPMRNMLDMITKNTTTMDGGPVSLPEAIRYNVQGFQMFNRYSKAMAAIIEHDGGLTEYGIKRFLANNPDIIDPDTFKFVHDYINSAVSGGMAKAQEELVLSYNLAKNGIEQNWYKRLVFNNKVTSTLMDVNSYAEHSARLGLLMQSLDSGLSQSSALNNVLKAHFDYSNLSYNEIIAQCFIPFVTFPLRNMEYWSKAIEGNMWLVRTLADATMYSNETYHQSQYTLENSSKLKYNLMSGNVKAFDTIIKTNPSLFDAAKLVTNPAGEMHNRLAPPIKQLVNAMPGLAKSIVDNVYAIGSKTMVLDTIIDGDTATFNINGKLKTVRFLAINTPEIYHGEGTTATQAYGEEAKTKLAQILENAKTITIKYDAKADRKDAYGRMLGWVYADGVLVQQEMIGSGYAKLDYVDDSYRYLKQLEAAQVKAQAEKTGRWATEYPSEFKINRRQEGYVNENVSPLEQTANDWGFYNINRAIGYATQTIPQVIQGQQELSNLLPPSMFEQNLTRSGNETGEFNVYRKLPNGSTLNEYTKEVTISRNSRIYKQLKASGKLTKRIRQTGVYKNK